MREPDRYRDLLVERLRALIESQGESVIRVEKRLGRGRGYVAEALRGSKKLSVEVILDVLDILDVKPEEFFERPADRGRGQLANRRTSGGRPAGAGDGETSPLAQAVLLLLADRGLSPPDLDEIQRQLGARLARARRMASPRSRARRR